MCAVLFLFKTKTDLFEDGRGGQPAGCRGRRDHAVGQVLQEGSAGRSRRVPPLCMLSIHCEKPRVAHTCAQACAASSMHAGMCSQRRHPPMARLLVDGNDKLDCEVTLTERKMANQRLT